MTQKVPYKFYKSYTNGVASYNALPSAGVGPGLTGVKDLSEIQTEIGKYTGKTDSWSKNYLSTLQSGLKNVQSGESPYALDEKGTLTTTKALESQAEEKRAFEAGETINTGTAEAPLYVPKGSPAATLKEDPKKYEQNYREARGSTAKPSGLEESSYKGVSIVDYLKSVGQSSSYGDREKLAKQYGISGYIGSADQNTKLLGMLRSATGSGATSGGVTVSSGDGVGVEKKTGETIAKDLGIDLSNQVFETSDSNRANESQLDVGGLPEKPASINYVSEWEAMRSEKGVSALEGQLSTTKDEITELEDQTRADLRDEEGKLMPMSLIAAHQQEVIKDRQEQIDALNRKQQNIVDQLNIANSAIDTRLSLQKMSYDDAKDDYNQQVNFNLKILDIVKSDESDELKAAEANWNTITNSIQNALIDGSIGSYYDIPEAIRVKLKDLELRQGLPDGFTETMLANISPGKSLKTTVTSNDKGKISYIYDDGTIEVYSTGVGDSGGEYGLTKEQTEDFYSEIKGSVNELQQGENWGNVWNRIKMKYPSVPDEVIDKALGLSWREEGAYEKFVAKKKTDSSITNPFQ